MKVLAAVAFAMLLPLMLARTASAAPPVQLLTTSPFAIIAGTAITDVPTSTIGGDVGLTPAAGTFYAGLTCAEVSGTIYDVNGTGPAPCVVNNPGLLTVAKNDLTTAYNDAASRIPDVTYNTADNQLGGLSLVPGVYRFGHAATANLVGNMDLNGNGNADSVWIFQATSDLVFNAASSVTLTGGAQACNVFWQVGSAATLRTTASVVGTIIAHDDITLDDAVTLNGRLFAGGQANQAGAVTLIHDTITTSNCASSGTGVGGGTETSTPAETAKLAEGAILAQAVAATGGSVPTTAQGKRAAARRAAARRRARHASERRSKARAALPHHRAPFTG